MDFYDQEENVSAYIKMAEGYDGKAFLPILRQQFKEKASILELGMGPGKDVEILSDFFLVTGSDRSQLFLDRYLERQSDADLILLDAVTLETERTFDCIYSNKVLYHLTKSQLRESFHKQACLLNHNGILFHTFWFGDQEENHSGLQMVYYTHETLMALVGDEYEEIDFKMYTEMEENDSFYIVLRKRN